MMGHTESRRTRIIKSFINAFAGFPVYGSGAKGIHGTVVNCKDEALRNVIVEAYQKGHLKGSGITDIAGNYAITSLKPGLYDVQASYACSDSVIQTSVEVFRGTVTIENFTLNREDPVNEQKRTITP